MRGYLRLLEKRRREGQDIRIDFAHVPVRAVRTKTPGSSAGLQLADAAAGALFNALERDRFGNTEPRYLKTISGALYRHEQKVCGYGLKVVPGRVSQIIGRHRSLVWLADFP
jgi:hypothetical protein